MQPPCLGACGGGGSLAVPVPRHLTFCPVAAPLRAPVSCATGAAGGGKTSPRGKDNVWSVDNERASAEKSRAPKHRRRRRPGGRRPSPPPSQSRRKGKDAGSRVLVSGAMLVEVETVLQTQEPVIKPSWDTFASSLTGNWKGVGAVFSPITAEMEPVGVGSKEEYLYDCYTLSHIEKSFDSVHGSEIRRKTNWVPINPFGEADKQTAAYDGGSLDASNGKGAVDLPAYESFDLNRSNILDEETFAMEPGIVFFEDGSYSRGPVDIEIGEYDESKYYLSPTYKFEQCLVKGCHKRLRIVHTIEFSEGGANIQIVRIAVYEEQWASPATIHVEEPHTPVSQLFAPPTTNEPTAGERDVAETGQTGPSCPIRPWDPAPGLGGKPRGPPPTAPRHGFPRGSGRVDTERETERWARAAGGGDNMQGARARGMDHGAGSFVAVRRLSGAVHRHASSADGVAGSTAWIGRGLSCVCAQGRESDARLSFDLSPIQEECLQRLQNRIEVPYDSSNKSHQEALKALWRASFPDTELLGLVSDQWKEMGWQGKDPSTDFRGGGFISLENLLYFSRNYPKSFRELLCKQNGDRALWEYPFAVAGVNITFMLIQMLDLEGAKPTSLMGAVFLNLLLENDQAFDILYCITFMLMDQKWLDMHATYMDFNTVIKSTRRQLERELLLEDIRRIEDMPSYRFLAR